MSERLNGWRRVTRNEDDTVEISAEKGYLREFGNIVFHFALLGLLVSVAVGKLFGYEGNVIVIADGGPGFCSASPAAFDSFRAGNTVDGTSLNPICLRVNDFDAHYLPSGQALSFAANIDYQAGADLDTDTWRPYHLKVNEPLRIGGDRVYLQGHGYAPTFTVTFPDGQTRTQTVQWRPDDPVTLLSSGVMRFDPPGGTYPNADERRKHQIAIQGLFAPTEQLHGTLLSSSFPALNNPAVAVDIYRGDTGLDTGRPQSLFSLDPRLIDQKRLTKVARVNLRAGEQTRLDDGTQVRFDGAVPFINVQVSHDPAQVWVLVSALTMMAGLLVSLIVRRRRVWVRIAARWCRYGKRRAGRTRSHRQLRLGRRVRAVDAPTSRRPRHRGAVTRRRSDRMNTEHIDIGLARYSDWAFTSSVVVLVIALLFLAVELAYARSRKVADRELVAAGTVSADSATPGLVADAPPRPFDERIGRAGLVLVYAGIGAALGVHRAARTGHRAGAVGQHVRVHQPDLLLGSGRGRDRAAPPAVPRAVGVRARAGADPADGVGPLAVHQRGAGDARAAVLLAAHPRVGGQPRLRGVPGRGRGQHPVPGQDVQARLRRTPRAPSPGSWQRLPDAQTLDRIAYRTTIFAFPVFGFGVIFGAIWAEEAWGRYWGWDPKETVSFIAWVIYAAYLHARSTAGWRDKKAAWINVAGFVAMVFNLFFINLVTVGLHSYAGVG